MKKLFYFLYHLIPARNNFQSQIRRANLRIQLASLFKQPITLILGDSNGHSLADQLPEIKGLAVNASIPGTTSRDWTEGLRTKTGQKFLRLCREADKTILNIGGNDALRDQMDGFQERIYTLKNWFSYCFIFDIIPAPDNVLKTIHKNAPKNVKAGNLIIKKVFGKHCLESSNLLKKFEDVWILVTDDGIHYTDAADSARIKVINSID